MFKILKSLSKSLGNKPVETKPAAESKAGKAAGAAAAGGGTLLDKVNKTPAGAAAAAAKAEPPKNPEELCGITPKMAKEDIKNQLKVLFRRYNRSASSLDAKVRAEADKMLDAIVSVREKHFGEI